MSVALHSRSRAQQRHLHIGVHQPLAKTHSSQIMTDNCYPGLLIGTDIQATTILTSIVGPHIYLHKLLILDYISTDIYVCIWFLPSAGYTSDSSTAVYKPGDVLTFSNLFSTSATKRSFSSLPGGSLSPKTPTSCKYDVLGMFLTTAFNCLLCFHWRLITFLIIIVCFYWPISAFQKSQSRSGWHALVLQCASRYNCILFLEPLPISYAVFHWRLLSSPFIDREISCLIAWQSHS